MSIPEPAAASGNIPYEVLLELHDIYLQRKHKLLSADLQTKEETKTIWFELNDEMKDFLVELTTDKLVSGIRVYFMAYPNQQTDMHDIIIPANPIDTGQLTIGMVATKSEGGKNPDYPESIAKVKMMVVEPINHGQLCPQICD